MISNYIVLRYNTFRQLCSLVAFDKPIAAIEEYNRIKQYYHGCNCKIQLKYANNGKVYTIDETIV